MDVLLGRILVLVLYIRLYVCQNCAPTDGTPGFDLDPCDRKQPCVPGIVMPDDTDCDFYFVCSSGLWSRKQCPASMKFTMITYQCCVTSSTAECQGPCPLTSPTPKPPSELCDSTPVVCNDSQVAPDRNNCDRYFECIFGAWNIRDCALGTAFDPVSLVCTPDIAAANCEYRCLTSAAQPTTAPMIDTTAAAEQPTTLAGTTARHGLTTSPHVNSTANSGTTKYDVITSTLFGQDVTTVEASTSADPILSSTTSVPRPPTISTTRAVPVTTSSPEDNSYVVIIGSTLGAVGAVALVVIAILSQNGIISCHSKPQDAPPLPNGVIIQPYFPTEHTLSSTSSPGSRDPEQMRKYQEQLRMYQAKRPQHKLLGEYPRYPVSVISERSEIASVSQVSSKSRKSRLSHTGLSVFDVDNKKLSKEERRRQLFEQQVNRHLARYQPASLSSESSATSFSSSVDEHPVYTEELEQVQHGPILGILGDFDV